MRSSKVLLGAVLVACLPVRAARADVRPRVAVIEASPIDLPTAGPRALRGAVEDAIRKRGADVVPFGDLTKAQIECQTPECFAGIARAVSATHVVRIEASGGEDRYDLQLEIWEAATGRRVEIDPWTCKLCLTRDVLGIARDRTGLLWSRLLQAEGSPATAPGAPLAPAPPADLQGPSSSGKGTANDPDHVPAPGAVPAWRWAVSGGGLAVGVVGIAWGAHLLAMNGDGACGSGDATPCAYTWSTGWAGGVALAVGGAVAIAATVDLIRLWRSSSRVAVSLAPNGIVAGGQF